MMGRGRWKLAIVLLMLAHIDPGHAAREPHEPFRIVMVTWRGWTDTDQGFTDYLERKRIPIELTVKDADRDPARLPDLVAEIKRLKPDLIYTWGTSVTRGILGTGNDPDPDQFITDIPAVFANVSQPVTARIVPSLASSGRNITGSTYLVPVESQLAAIRSYRPFQRLGVIYNGLENNSRLAVAELRAQARTQNYRLIERQVPLQTGGEPSVASLSSLVAEIAAAGAEFLFIPPDSFLSRHKAPLTESALEHRLPTFSAAEGTLKGSKSMMGLISRYYNIGKLSGRQAERILIEEERPADIPIVSLSRYSLVLNMPVIRELGLYPPMSLLGFAEILD